MIIYTISDVRPLIHSYYFDLETMMGDKPPYFLTGALAGWLPFSIQYRTIAFVILPILAAFPYGGSEYTEEQSHYNSNVILRCGKRIYYECKVFTMFVSGASIAAYMLILSFAINLVLLPIEHVTPVIGMIPMDHIGVFSEVFYKAPVVYVIIYILFVSVVCGALTLICFVATELFSNVFIVILFPEMLHFSLSIPAQMLNVRAVTWNYLQMHHMTKDLVIPVLLEGVVLGIIVICILMHKTSKRRDIL